MSPCSYSDAIWIIQLPNRFLFLRLAEDSDEVDNIDTGSSSEPESAAVILFGISEVAEAVGRLTVGLLGLLWNPVKVLQL